MPKKSEVVDLEKDFTEVVDELQGIEEPDAAIANDLPPDRTSPKWTDHVLADLTDKEKFKDLPRVAGLRRLVEKYIGKIISMKPEIQWREMESFTKHDKSFSVPCVVCTETIKVREHGTNEVLEFAGIGDASPYNTEPTFVKFLDRMAETRAKGRAFINALAIQCNALEEMVDKPALTQDDLFVEKITDAQLNGMDNLARKFNVNVQKLLASKKDEFAFKRIRDITKEQGSVLMKLLNSYQQGASIPQSFVGYDPKWKPREND